MFKLLEINLFKSHRLPAQLSDLSLIQILVIGSAFLIPVFSALRLAKFNVDERQTSSFIGLPTPANALFISSLALIQEHGNIPAIDNFLLNIPVLLVLTFLFSYLLVSEIPMFSLKFKNLSFQPNKIRYIFISLSAVMILLIDLYGIAATILLFILISVFLMYRKR